MFCGCSSAYCSAFFYLLFDLFVDHLLYCEFGGGLFGFWIVIFGLGFLLWADVLFGRYCVELRLRFFCSWLCFWWDETPRASLESHVWIHIIRCDITFWVLCGRYQTACAIDNFLARCCIFLQALYLKAIALDKSFTLCMVLITGQKYLISPQSGE